MTISELLEKLKALDPALPVMVYDGLDPSDPCIATEVNVFEASKYFSDDTKEGTSVVFIT